MKRFFLILSSLMMISGTIMAQDSPLWLRRNDISPDGTKIVFNYKGDIYVVPTAGGEAKQITTNTAYDTDPMWTADGKEIIFASYREKGKDIYKVSEKGSAPTRLTTHVANETPLAVLKDGRILYTANIQQDAAYGDFPGNAQLYVIGMDGGRPTQVTSLPISALSVNDEGTVIYEDWKGYEDPLRKHHTSSVTRDIWAYRPAAGEQTLSINGQGSFTKLSSFKGEDRNPVFAADGNTFYYLSEADGTINIYKSSLNSPEKSEQLTFFKGNPVRHLSVADNGTMTFSYDGELYRMASGKQPEKVSISIVTDQTQRPVVEQTLTSGATSLAVSPDGKEIAIVLRGDVFVTSADHRTTKRITNTAEQERGVSFSKDGRTLYYASERNGHWGIWSTSLTDKNDKGPHRRGCRRTPVPKAGWGGRICRRRRGRESRPCHFAVPVPWRRRTSQGPRGR